MMMSVNKVYMKFPECCAGGLGKVYLKWGKYCTEIWVRYGV